VRTTYLYCGASFYAAKGKPAREEWEEAWLP